MIKKNLLLKHMRKTFSKLWFTMEGYIYLTAASNDCCKDLHISLQVIAQYIMPSNMIKGFWKVVTFLFLHGKTWNLNLCFLYFKGDHSHFLLLSLFFLFFFAIRCKHWLLFTFYCFIIITKLLFSCANSCLVGCFSMKAFYGILHYLILTWYNFILHYCEWSLWSL